MTTNKLNKDWLDGNAWERYALEHLRKKYADVSETELVPVPAAHDGDLGIEAFTRTRQTIYQCYAAENYESASELYSKQRKKITNDIGKLSKADKVKEIKKLFGSNVVIKQWILIVPQHRSRHLISHANTKAEELRNDANRPSYISDGFIAHIWTEDDLIANCGKLDISSYGINQILSVRGSWARAIYESTLWPSEADLGIKLASARMADFCWGYITSEKINPWQDDDYPLRVIKSIEKIYSQLTKNKLTENEASLLLTTPLLRYAKIVLTEKLEFINVQISVLDSNSDLAVSNVYRGQYETFIAKHPQLERKARRLQSQEKEGSEWVVWWMFSQSLRDVPNTWNFDLKNTDTEFFNQFEKIAKNLPILQETDLYRLLIRTEGIGVDEIIDRPDVYISHAVLKSRDDPIRFSFISILLSIAGKMALDPLVLSEVIVDHIGISFPTSPRLVLSNLKSIRWVSIDKTLQLDLKCNHPAIDMAISKVVDILASYQRLISEHYKGIQFEDYGLNSLLPFNADRLLPKINGKSEAYIKPHVSFKLAQDEVKELLMGVKLYGNPSLAIRELYQNALDACRYQETRYKYRAKRLGQSDGDFGWIGRIQIEQGVDPDKGEYIECKDNGVGMRQSDLINFFAKAGRRFVEGDEYLQERSEWQKLGIEHYPNSQFGIGVFSYFMLAEELEITSRYMKKDGGLDKIIVVKVSGSGSLFHIRQDTDGMFNHGTKVRLYLNRTSYKDNKGKEIKVSALNTLKKYLWIADYQTTVIEGDKNHVWQAYELYPQSLKQVPIASSKLDVIQVNSDLWWVGEDPGYIDSDDLNGRILVDGLLTETKSPSLIVNLHGASHPRMSVDRKEVLDWPRAEIRSNLNKNGWEVLIENPFKTAQAFYVAAKYYPITIQKFLDNWNKPLLLPYNSIYLESEIDLNQIGIFLPDTDLMRYARDGQQVQDDELAEWQNKNMFLSRNIFTQRLFALSSQFDMKLYVSEWLNRNPKHPIEMRLEPIHTLALQSRMHIFTKCEGADFYQLVYELDESEENILERLKPLAKMGVHIDGYIGINNEKGNFKTALENRIKNYYSRFSLTPPAIDWSKISNDLDSLDIEILSGEKVFPITRIPFWKVVLLKYVDKVSEEVLSKKIETWTAISSLDCEENFNYRFNKDDLGLSFANDKFIIPPCAATLIHKIVSNEVTRGTEDIVIMSALLEWKKLGLTIPDTAENALKEIDDIDKTLLSKSTEVSALCCRGLIEFLSTGKINVDEIEDRLNRYRKIGIPTNQDDFSSILSKNDAIEVESLSNQNRVLPYSVLDRVTKLGGNLGHLRQALKWYADNDCHVPIVNWEKLPSYSFTSIDRNIILRCSLVNEQINYDIIAAAIIIFDLRKDDFEERLDRYACLGVKLPVASKFSKTWDYIEAYQWA